MSNSSSQNKTADTNDADDPLSKIKHLQSEIDRLKKQLDDAKRRPLRVVVTGGFSSGKSAFINWLLNTDAAPEGAVPTTRICTEFVYGEKEFYYDFAKKKTTKQHYQELAKDPKNKGSLTVALPNPLLKGIVLVDTPGFDANNEDNDLAIGTMRSADIVFWLICVTDGTLHETYKKHLKEGTVIGTSKSKYYKPLAMILTQADNASEGLKSLERIKEKVIADAESFLRIKHCTFVSVKENKILPSLRQYLKDQKNKLNKFLLECVYSFDKKPEVGRIQALYNRRLEEMRVLLNKKTKLLLEEIVSLKDDLEAQRNKTLESFKRELRNVCEDIVCNVNCNRKSYVSQKKTGEGWFFDDYETRIKEGRELYLKGFWGKNPDVKIAAVIKKYTELSPEGISDIFIQNLGDEISHAVPVEKSKYGGQDGDYDIVLNRLRQYMFVNKRNEIIENFHNELCYKYARIEWMISPQIHYLNEELEDAQLQLRSLKEFSNKFSCNIKIERR